jgi:hypothetical protein
LLIQKIEIFPGTFKMHFFVGKDYVEGELAFAGALLGERAHGGLEFFTPLKNRNVNGSNSVDKWRPRQDSNLRPTD